MTDVIFEYSVTNKMRNRETVATGKRGPENRSSRFNMADLTEDQRAVVMTAVEVSSHKVFQYVASIFWVAAPVNRGENIVVNLRSLAQPSDDQSYGVFATTQSFQLDDEPTAETAVALTAKATEALRNVIDHHEATVARMTAAYDECVALLATDEVAAVEKARQAGILEWNPPDQRLCIGHMHRMAEQQRRNEIEKRVKAQREAIAKQREADKAAWIAEHGSDHLKLAFGRGYDSQRQYALERAAIEAPGWTLDFNGSSDWNSRSFPSVEALAVEDEAAALAEKLDARNSGVVWLTKPATSGHDSDEEVWGFEQCEAVAIRAYLGQYDLVKMID